jgi:hypothetical protein
MHLFGHNFDHDYFFELLREEERDTHSITRCSTSHHRLFGLSRGESNFVSFPKSHSWRIIRYKQTASFLAMATLAIFPPRLIVRWRYWQRATVPEQNRKKS